MVETRLRVDCFTLVFRSARESESLGAVEGCRGADFADFV